MAKLSAKVEITIDHSVKAEAREKWTIHIEGFATREDTIREIEAGVRRALDDGRIRMRFVE